MRKTRCILGVDPGTRITGYALIRTDGQAYEVVDFGAIRPPVLAPLPQRYLVIFEAITHLIEQFSPDDLSVETQFVSKNIQSAIKLGMARASIVLAAAKKGVAVHEYTPSKAKLAIAGSGSASKYQVQKMMQLLLKLKELPEPEDAADALALAVCHAHHLVGI